MIDRDLQIMSVIVPLTKPNPNDETSKAFKKAYNETSSKENTTEKTSLFLKNYMQTLEIINEKNEPLAPLSMEFRVKPPTYKKSDATPETLLEDIYSMTNSALKDAVDPEKNIEEVAFQFQRSLCWIHASVSIVNRRINPCQLIVGDNIDLFFEGFDSVRLLKTSVH